MPSGHGPPPSFYSKSDPVPHDAASNGERRSSGREQQPQVGGLSAAQAYQASTGYHSPSSPASMVFPHRAPGHSQGESMRSSAFSTSQSPPLAKRPSVGNVAEEGGYVNSLGKMNLGSSGSRPLDGVGGIPRIGEFSDFGSFETDFSGKFRRNCHADKAASTNSSLPYQSSGHQPRQPSISSVASGGTHRRMASDASLAGSGYTISGGSRQYIT